MTDRRHSFEPFWDQAISRSERWRAMLKGLCLGVPMVALGLYLGLDLFGRLRSPDAASLVGAFGALMVGLGMLVFGGGGLDLCARATVAASLSRKVFRNPELRPLVRLDMFNHYGLAGPEGAVLWTGILDIGSVPGHRHRGHGFWEILLAPDAEPSRVVVWGGQMTVDGIDLDRQLLASWSGQTAEAADDHPHPPPRTGQHLPSIHRNGTQANAIVARATIPYFSRADALQRNHHVSHRLGPGSHPHADRRPGAGRDLQHNRVSSTPSDRGSGDG